MALPQRPLPQRLGQMPNPQPCLLQIQSQPSLLLEHVSQAHQQMLSAHLGALPAHQRMLPVHLRALPARPTDASGSLEGASGSTADASGSLGGASGSPTDASGSLGRFRLANRRFRLADRRLRLLSSAAVVTLCLRLQQRLPDYFVGLTSAQADALPVRVNA